MLECSCNKGDIKIKANGSILEIGADIMTIINSILNRISTTQANALYDALLAGFTNPDSPLVKQLKQKGQ